MSLNRANKKFKTLNKSKRKNPLYVVTDNGSIVEEASNFVDAFFKKYGLDPFLSLLDDILFQLLALVKSFPILEAVNNFISELMEKLEVFTKRVYPEHFLFKA